MKVPSLRALASKKIHPQLPLDPRQAQQLLAVLKTSFQNQLDLAHPAPGSTWTQATAATSASPPHNTRSRPQLPQALAVQHIDNILSNPLLESRPDPLSFLFGGEPRRLQSLSGPVKLSEAHEWFTNHVASGSADTLAAKAYLQAVYRACFTLNGPVIRKRLEEAGSGRRVLQWLFSDMEHFSAVIWKDHDLCHLLAKCLVAEKRNDDIQKLLQLPSCEQVDLRWRRRLVQSSVTSSLGFGIDIAEVVQTFLSNVQAFREAPAMTQAEMATFVLSAAGSHVSAAVIAPDSGISTRLYDTLVDSLPLWAAPYSLPQALLSLHHPNKPDAGSVVLFLNQKHTQARLSQMSPSKRRRVLQMCLDATQLLLTQRDFTTSTWLLAFTKRNFFQELAAEKVYSSEHENAMLRQFSELQHQGTEHMGDLVVG